jgi:hypothetical protein
MTRNESAHQLTLNELLRREGRSFEEIAEAVMFGDENAPALSAPQVAKSNQMELANMASLPCSAPQG